MNKNIPRIAWLIAVCLCIIACYLGWKKWIDGDPQPQSVGIETELLPTPIEIRQASKPLKALPNFQNNRQENSIPRVVSLKTDFQNWKKQEIIEFSVSTADSIFGIAQYFNIQPETILWSNYDILKDNPHALSVGMVLKIPPIDGVYYQWREGDTIESVASEFATEANEILSFSGNRFDLTNPKVETDAWIMLPEGKREFQQWIIPVMPRGASGVSAGLYGGGACAGGYDGLYGSGAFIWPTYNHTISGNDYWSGHLAIDIGAAFGEPISASDAGVVVFAGWASGGYGYTVAIDHGNGYQTLYAHLSSVVANCGQSVSQGQTIGYGGSTGNSTGPHLHFEIRYQGGFVNPWYVLPSP